MLQLASILVSLFVGYGLVIEDPSLITRLPDIISYLCPSSDVCSSNRSSETKDYVELGPEIESCCAECSCSAECSRTDNCCFPNTMPPKNVTTGKVEDFQNGRSCLYPVVPQPKTELFSYQSFLMVSTVQNNSNSGLDGLSNVSCGDINVAPWGSLYPVYSVKSRQIYKNIECAREAGIDVDFIPWNAVINCKDVKSTPGISSAASVLDAESITENCNIHFTFPGDYDVLKPLKCYINLTDTCPESQDFQIPEGTDVSKDDVVTLCTKSGFLSPYRAQTKVYANAFCHICNEAFYRHRVCKKYTEDAEIKSGREKGVFTALIDYKFIIGKGDANNHKKHVLPTVCSVIDVNSCREILCPTGQLRDRTNKCVYPNKIWYNQNYAVFINLTFGTLMNVSEAFGIQYKVSMSRSLPSLKSVWLENWSVDTIYVREMDESELSNNLIIIMRRNISSVQPDVIIANITKMIGQAWSIRVRNVTLVLKSENFSVVSKSIGYGNYNYIKGDNFYNLTENLEWPEYAAVYSNPTPSGKIHTISRLYTCDQVELEPSEFLLNSNKDALYIYTLKRVLFDNQFSLMRRNTFSEHRARICKEDSGLYERNTNVGAILKTFDLCFVVVSLLLIFHLHNLL